MSLPKVHWGDPVIVADLSLEERGQYGLTTPSTIVEVIGDQSLVEEAVDRARTKGYTGWDRETTGLSCFKDRVILHQMGDEEVQYVIWWETIDPTPLLALEEEESVFKIGSNLKFDLKFSLSKHNLDADIKRIYDCQLVEGVLTAGFFYNAKLALMQTGVAAQARRWLGLKIPKDEELRTGWGDHEPGTLPLEKLLYAADDVVLPIMVAKKQRPWVDYLGLRDTVKLEMAYLPVVARQEVVGIGLDWEQWIKLADNSIEKFGEAQDTLDKLFNLPYLVEEDLAGNKEVLRKVNYGSTEELADLVYKYVWDKYGIHVIASNKKFRELLEESGRIAVTRLDKLFEAKMVDDPDNPGKRKKIGYPNMTDLVEKLWEEYSEWLPKSGEAIPIPSLNTKDLLLNKIIWETPESVRDPKLPNSIGLPPELVDALLDYSLYGKRQSTYGYNWEDYLDESTGRFHTDWFQVITSTGRVSSSPNLQNLPAIQDYRSCFVARPGYSIVGSDYSQIEPRILAEYSKDPVYMRVFWSERPGTRGYEFWCQPGDNMLDLYASVGSAIGLLSPDQITKEACKATEAGIEGRDQSKTTSLSLIYGTGKYKFWLTLMRDMRRHYKFYDAIKLYDGFWDSVSNIKDTLEELSNLADPEGSRLVNHFMTSNPVSYAETLGGRKRFFKKGWNSWTEGRNAPIQGTGADILKRACVEVDKETRRAGLCGHIVITAHDEILAEVKDENAEEYAKIMGDVMVRVGEHYCPHVPINTEPQITKCWVKD